MTSIKVLIADDQHLFAESLKYVLEGASDGRIDVIGIAADGAEAIEFVESEKPDVVLMDIRMPGMDGVEATARIHERHPTVRIMILTTFDDDELAVNALASGATAYVLKDVDPPDLILSVEAVHRGAFFISPKVGVKLVDIMRPGGREHQRERESMIADLIATDATLTRREAEILYLAAKARTNKEIGEELSISDKTVKNHLSAIYQKLHIHNRLQLIGYVANVRNRVDERPQ